MAAASFRFRNVKFLALAALLALGSLGAALPAARAQTGDGGVATIVGTVNSDLAQNPYGYMILTDLTGFVTRNIDYPQGDHVIVGWFDHKTGAYEIDLPIHPAAPLNNVAHGQGAGVEIFSVDAYYDAIWDPRPDQLELTGWSSGDSSMATVHSTHEATGGKILVWAPDANQFFPTGWGPDGKLFTADDPIGSIGAGWTVIDLDQNPFGQIRIAKAEVQLAQNDLKPLDFSQLAPVDAFNKLVDLLKARYPLPVERPIDWEGLRAKFLPEFQAAQGSGDKADFTIAVNDFLIAVGVRDNFTNVPFTDEFLPQFLGTTGLHVDETSDGHVIVIKVDPGQSAEKAGIQVGAEILTWNGVAAADAVQALPQFFANSSPLWVLDYKLAFLGRAPAGTAIPVVYRNPDSTATASATLTAVEIPGENIGRATGCIRVIDECSYQTPLTVQMLPSGIEVIRIRIFGSDAQDVRLIGEAWDRAITAANGADVKGIILDVRSAGPQLWFALPMYMASSFLPSDTKIAEATSVDENGKTLHEFTYKTHAGVATWNRPVAVIVNERCEGNCELFVQAMTHVPNVIIAGMSATAGAVVIGYQTALLPDDDFVNFVEYALRDPQTHQPIIEGTGIAPTLLVPRTAANLVAAVTGDPVRDAAEQALLAQIASASAATATPAP